MSTVASSTIAVPIKDSLSSVLYRRRQVQVQGIVIHIHLHDVLVGIIHDYYREAA
ncbi:MAG: hypothetical protein M0Z94_20000 [Dehalococcoidales bacterium]|nr:hypothetical protein [Dehalococcoidales bacterium]